MRLGDELARELYHDLDRVFQNLILAPSYFRPPKLGIVQVGDNPASNKYISIKKNRIEKLGWDAEHVKLDHQASEEEFKKVVLQMSNDKNTDGIIVQLPLPKHYTNAFLDLIPYTKDVDGLTIINQGKLFRGFNEKDYLAPCTAKACIYFLEQNHVNIRGAHVAVLGRSNLVGAPIGILLQQRGATVIQVNQFDKSQSELTRLCDVMVSAIGVPWYVTKEYVKPGAFLVDIGVSEVDGNLLGDVHAEVREIANVSPSKGGIGPLTVAFLMSNLLQSYMFGIENAGNHG